MYHAVLFHVRIEPTTLSTVANAVTTDEPTQLGQVFSRRLENKSSVQITCDVYLFDNQANNIKLL